LYIDRWKTRLGWHPSTCKHSTSDLDDQYQSEPETAQSDFMSKNTTIPDLGPIGWWRRAYWEVTHLRGSSPLRHRLNEGDEWMTMATRYRSIDRDNSPVFVGVKTRSHLLWATVPLLQSPPILAVAVRAAGLGVAKPRVQRSPPKGWACTSNTPNLRLGFKNIKPTKYAS